MTTFSKQLCIKSQKSYAWDLSLNWAVPQIEFLLKGQIRSHIYWKPFFFYGALQSTFYHVIDRRREGYKNKEEFFIWGRSPLNTICFMSKCPSGKKGADQIINCWIRTTRAGYDNIRSYPAHSGRIRQYTVISSPLWPDRTIYGHIHYPAHSGRIRQYMVISSPIGPDTIIYGHIHPTRAE